MYFADITLLSVLCVISEQSTFNRQGQGIYDITAHTAPGGTILVRFSHNFFSFVPANHFKNLPSLHEIVLDSNAITDIDDTAFAQVPTVTRIDLGSNQLTVIREMMFSGLPNLSELRLAINQIHTIELGSFKGNAALTELYFGSNSLETVSQSIFDPNNHPTSLNFYMNNNPLHCDSLCWLMQADKTWITVGWASITGCVGPAVLAGCKWDSLTEQDLCKTFNTSG